MCPVSFLARRKEVEISIQVSKTGTRFLFDTVSGQHHMRHLVVQPPLARLVYFFLTLNFPHPPKQTPARWAPSTSLEILKTNFIPKISQTFQIFHLLDTEVFQILLGDISWKALSLKKVLVFLIQSLLDLAKSVSSFHPYLPLSLPIPC